MRFIDETLITAISGAGGDGLCSFKATKNCPKQGADGGDGGRGGHVYLQADPRLNTLSKLRFKEIFKALPGGRGGVNGRTGKSGADKTIPVPLGTVVRNAATGEMICEILQPNQKERICSGGTPGRGNAHFLKPQRQMPTWYTKGTPGEELRLHFELKLLADVGLAGLPNAGKSSLLRAISSARPRVADYPFTTLEPQLGVVDLLKETGSFDHSFVVADIPGLIEGASEGKGLGLRFLKHLERTKVTAYVIEPEGWPERNPYQTYELLRDELDSFNPELVERTSMIILTKLDLYQNSVDIECLTHFFGDLGLPVVAVSSATHAGMAQLKTKLFELITAAKQHDDWEQLPLELPPAHDFEIVVRDPLPFI